MAVNKLLGVIGDEVNIAFMRVELYSHLPTLFFLIVILCTIILCFFSI